MFKFNDPTPDHLSMKSLENHHRPETPSEKVKNRFIGGDIFVRLPRFSEGRWGLYGPSFKYQSTIFNRFILSGELVFCTRFDYCACANCVKDLMGDFVYIIFNCLLLLSLTVTLMMM